VKGKDALPVRDCSPVAIVVHAPDLMTCKATARPTRTGPNFTVAVPVWDSTTVVGIETDADCATTLRVLVALRYSACTLLGAVTFGARTRTAYDPTPGALKVVE
jgi:hypothetical protein